MARVISFGFRFKWTVTRVEITGSCSPRWNLFKRWSEGLSMGINKGRAKRAHERDREDDDYPIYVSSNDTSNTISGHFYKNDRFDTNGSSALNVEWSSRRWMGRVRGWIERWLWRRVDCRTVVYTRPVDRRRYRGSARTFALFARNNHNYLATTLSRMNHTNLT